jgi:hypothetical protein
MQSLNGRSNGPILRYLPKALTTYNYMMKSRTHGTDPQRG